MCKEAFACPGDRLGWTSKSFLAVGVATSHCLSLPQLSAALPDVRAAGQWQVQLEIVLVFRVLPRRAG
jgi:hypothetical protein